MQQRPTIVRVKRKRRAEAPEDLVVEGLGAAAKRAHTSLAAQLGGLGLEGGPEPTTGAQQPARPRPQRFRRLTTLTAAQVSSLDEAQLAQLLAAQQHVQQHTPLQHGEQQQEGQAAQNEAAQGTQPPEPQAGVTPAVQAQPPAARGGFAAPLPPFQQQQQQHQPGQPAAGGRYEQIRQRRGGLSVFRATEEGPDPLPGFARVYEVVRREGEAPVQPPQWQDSAEGTLMCDEQPAVRRALGGGESVAGGRKDGTIAERMDAGGEAGAAAESEGDDEYVYDLYAMAAEEEGEGAEWWLEMHTSGRAPVIQILDDESWLVVESSDVEDSDADTEDSNAEGYYAHDYPDEVSDSSWEGDEDGHDPEGRDFRRKPGGGRRDWWEESDGEGGGGGSSDGEGGGGPWGGVRAVGPRGQW